MRSFVKDNLKLYLDFKASKHNTLKFPCEGSTDFVSGSSQYIDCGNSSSLQITGKTITVSAWFRLDSDSDWDKIVANSDGGSYVDGFTLFYQDDKLHFSINHFSTNAATVAFTDFGAWHHVVGVYDGTLPLYNVKIYLDGVLGTTDNYTSDIGNNRNTYIGAGYNTSVTDFFDGKIANVGIWDRALSIEEVNSVMRKNYSQLKTVEKTSLVSWWSLDEEVADSTQLLDQAGRFYDADDWNGYGGGTFDDAGGTHIAITAGTSVEYQMGGYLYSYTAYMNGTSTNWYVGGRYRLISTTTSSIGSTTSGLSVYGHRVQSVQDELPSGSSVYDFTGATNIHNQSFFRFHDMAQGETLTTTLEIYHLLAKDQHGSNNGRQYGTGITAGTQTLGSADSPTVYGGNAPVLPRAVDVAREGEAEAIGNGSALFSGSSEYISIADNDLFSMGDGSNDHKFSITAWINMDDATDFIIASKGLYNSNGEFSFETDASDRLRLVLMDESVVNTYEIAYSGALTQNEWIHVACTYNGVGGTSANAGIKLYINGINQSVSLLDSGTHVSLENLAGDLYIGKYDSNYSDGEISQLGIWKGELTQSQIQSVMESTSYATIPASVKSTLGAELVTLSVTDSWTGSNVSVNEASTDYAYSGTQSRKYTTSGSGGVDGITSNTFATVLNSLYKLDCWVYSPSDSDIVIKVIQGDGSGTSLSETITIATGQWVHIVRYFIELAGGSSSELTFGQQTGSVTQYIDNVSVKLVTNDLVGYWGLDASDYTSASNHITNGDASSASPSKPEWNISGQDFVYSEYNSTITRVTDFGSSGDTCWKITATSASHNWGLKTTDADMNVGRSYKVTVKVYIPSSTDITTIDTRWFEGSSGTGGTVSTSTKDTWVDVTYIIGSFWGADGAYSQVVNFIGNNASASDYFYFDDLVIKPHSVPDSTDNNNVGDLI